MTIQYLRTISLTIGDDAGHSIDLSDMHIRFLVQGATLSTLKYCEVRIWNLSADTANQVAKEFTQITLKAGYQGNNQIIFQGQIGRIALGREDSVDSYCDLFCQDGDLAANWGVVNRCLPEGYTDDDVFQTLMAEFNQHGVTLGYKMPLRTRPSVGTKTLSGQVFDYMTQLADANDADWFIDNAKLNIVPKKGVLPSTAVPTLSSATGLIGTATQTFNGINVRCLLNPEIRIGCPFNLDNGSINTMTQRPGVIINESMLVVPDINRNGIYKAFSVQHTGDTREQEWYTDLIAVDVDGTIPNSGSALVSVPSGN